MSDSIRRAKATVAVAGLLCAIAATTSACDTPSRARPAAKVMVIPDTSPAPDPRHTYGMTWLETYLATQTPGAAATSATAGQ